MIQFIENENYYPKVFLEKYYFIEDIKIYCSNSDEEHYGEECVNLVLETLKEKKFLVLELESSISQNIRSFFRVGFSYFSSLQSYFLK